MIALNSQFGSQQDTTDVQLPQAHTPNAAQAYNTQQALEPEETVVPIKRSTTACVNASQPPSALVWMRSRSIALAPLLFCCRCEVARAACCGRPQPFQSSNFLCKLSRAQAGVQGHRSRVLPGPVAALTVAAVVRSMNLSILVEDYCTQLRRR